MSANSEEIVIKKGKVKLMISTKVKTSKGFLFVIKFVRTVQLEAVFGGVANKRPITVDKAHGLLTHFGEADTRATARHLDMPLQRGPLKSCLACGLAKAKKKKFKSDQRHSVKNYSSRRLTKRAWTGSAGSLEVII